MEQGVAMSAIARMVGVVTLSVVGALVIATGLGKIVINVRNIESLTNREEIQAVGVCCFVVCGYSVCRQLEILEWKQLHQLSLCAEEYTAVRLSNWYVHIHCPAN